MRLEIRMAKTSDIHILQNIARRTIRADYSPFMGEKSVADFIDSGASDHYIADNIGNCTVICLEETVAGLSVCKKDLIDLMMIDFNYHRRGLGSALLRHCEEVLFKTYRNICLESFEDNNKANAFYRKNRWTTSKLYPDKESGLNKFLFIKNAS